MLVEILEKIERVCLDKLMEAIGLRQSAVYDGEYSLQSSIY